MPGRKEEVRTAQTSGPGEWDFDALLESVA
jgi:hypothetical protein